MSGANKPAGAREAAPPPLPRPMTGVDMTTVKWIPMELLHRSPYQVRREGDVRELAADIQAHGLINPISVRKRAQGDGFEIVAGHRRWAAMRSVDAKAEVPCIILDVDDKTAEELLVAENFVRSDLSIMEQAETVRLLTEHGRTAEECGQVCRRSVRWAHRMRAIGGVVEPWRGFFHVAGLPYACVLAVARLPEAVREEAWQGLWDDVANDLTLADDDEAGVVGEALADEMRGADLATMRARLAGLIVVRVEADEILLDSLKTDAGLRAFLEESPENGPRFGDDSFDGPIGRAMSKLRILRDAPFGAEGACAHCKRRSDAAPDLWCEDDGRAMPARCLDGACWRKRCAEHAREVVAQAAAAGVSSKPIRASEYNYADRDTLDEAVACADGDRGRVAPVVRVDANGEPTGRVLWRVAPKPVTEDGVAGSSAPPPKREPWEEWRPENPRWTPMLMGDKRDRAWLAVGIVLGAYAPEADVAAWEDRLLDEDAMHFLVRSPQIAELDPDGRRGVLETLAADLPRKQADCLDGVRAIFAEARKHLPAKDGEAAGESWEDGGNE